MRFSRYFIDIDLKSKTGEHILINGGNGLVDRIRKEEYQILSMWYSKNEGLGDEQRIVSPELFDLLVKRGYIIEDTFDEEHERNKLINKLCQKSQIRQEACNSACFIPTYSCNFACPYCYEHDVDSHTRMTKEQVDLIFKLNGEHIRNISFFGGEPLLLSNKELIAYIVSKAPDAHYSIITNGYYLEEYFDLFRNLDFGVIQVTFDGQKEDHNKSRKLKNGKGTFDKIMQGVELYCRNGLAITIRMNVTPQNLESCKMLKQQVTEQPWAEMVRFELQPVFQTDAAAKANLDKKLFKDDIASNRKNEMLRRQTPLASFLYLGTPLQPIVKACDADSKYRFYDPDGNVYSCILSVGNPKKRIATYSENGIEYEQNSMLTRNISTIPACQKCKYALLCGGGCPNAIPNDKDIVTTPNCGYLKYKIDKVIPMIHQLMFEETKAVE